MDEELTGGQLNDIALKGRDFFALLATIPGVVDTTQSGEATSSSSLSGTFINGARDNQKNFSVDGLTGDVARIILTALRASPLRGPSNS